MPTISQRQLRNDNAAVMSDVERGETYTITRRGVPVARLTPITDAPGLPCAKPAKRRLDPGTLRRVPSKLRTEDVIDELRGDR